MHPGAEGGVVDVVRLHQGRAGPVESRVPGCLDVRTPTPLRSRPTVRLPRRVGSGQGESSRFTRVRWGWSRGRCRSGSSFSRGWGYVVPGGHERSCTLRRARGGTMWGRVTHGAGDTPFGVLCVVLAPRVPTSGPAVGRTTSVRHTPSRFPLPAVSVSGPSCPWGGDDPGRLWLGPDVSAHVCGVGSPGTESCVWCLPRRNRVPVSCVGSEPSGVW